MEEILFPPKRISCTWRISAGEFETGESFAERILVKQIRKALAKQVKNTNYKRNESKN